MTKNEKKQKTDNKINDKLNEQINSKQVEMQQTSQKSKFLTPTITKEFMEMKKYFENYDSNREKIIIQSREIIKLSKLIIFNVQSKKNESLNQLITDIKKSHFDLLTFTKANPFLRNEGTLNMAEQELAEAILFKSMVLDHILLTSKDLKIKYENYANGLADLSGELLRFAIIEATNKNFNLVYELRQFMNDIYYLLLDLNLRSQEFRHKFDSVKYALKRLDEICYDISKKD